MRRLRTDYLANMLANFFSSVYLDALFHPFRRDDSETRDRSQAKSPHFERYLSHDGRQRKALFTTESADVSSKEIEGILHQD
jgi:hypothetical protein